MKTTRKELLEANLSKEENVESTVKATVAKDAKFLKRSKRDLEDKIEDLKEQLETRLSSNLVLDKAVIESSYSALKDAEALLALYVSFEDEFITEGE